VPVALERVTGTFRAAEPRIDRLAGLPNDVEPGKLTGHVVLVGYGRVGLRVGEALRAAGVPLVVVEQNREVVERLRAQGVLAVGGDAGEPATLVQAHAARARALVVAAPDAARARAMIDTARRLNPDIRIMVRTHSDEEAELMRSDHVEDVFMGEHELARSMTRRLLERYVAT
jgi:monovalent cation:H+ antiporter-2, CPA2 family